MKKNLIITLLALVAFTAQNLTMAQTPFGNGESLSYAVSYRAKLIPNINVMRVTLRTVAEDLGGKPHYHIVGNGITGGGAKVFFNLNDTYHSWLDASTLRPTRMTSDLQEDDRRFKATYTYNWGAMQVGTTLRNAKWNADQYYTSPLKNDSGDALSILYKLRALDADKLEQGKRYPLDLVMDKTTRTIYYTYLGRTEIKIKKMGRFKAIKIKCTMATSDGTTYEEGMELTAWISDDKNHIPLLIESPIRVGNVRITLTGHKTVHPLDSLIK